MYTDIDLYNTAIWCNELISWCKLYSTKEVVNKNERLEETDLNMSWLEIDEEVIANNKANCDSQSKPKNPYKTAHYTHLSTDLFLYQITRILYYNSVGEKNYKLQSETLISFQVRSTKPNQTNAGTREWDACNSVSGPGEFRC